VGDGSKLKPLLEALNREREDHHRTLQEFYAVQENLHEQTARTSELERANHHHWAHIERSHKEAQEENQRLTKAGDDLRRLQWMFQVRGEGPTRLQNRIVDLCSNEDKLRH
jgi:hypothetical protein